MRSGLVAAVALALGCVGGAIPPVPPGPAAPIPGSIGSFSVAAGGGPALGADPGSAERAAREVRQSALDWLEQAGRLAPDGELEVAVTLDSLRLRGALVTWLFAWAAAPDHLAASVAVRRNGHRVGGFLLRVESALAGRPWRDPGDRVDRLARRLGRRLAGRLDGAL